MLQKLFQVVGNYILGPQFPLAPIPLDQSPVLNLFKGYSVKGPAGLQCLGDGERAEWEQVKGGMLRGIQR